MKKTEQTQNKKSSQKKSILADIIPCDRNDFHGTPALTLSQQNLKKHLRNIFNKKDRRRLIDILAYFENFGVSVQDLHKCIMEMIDDGEIISDGEALVKTQ